MTFGSKIEFGVFFWKIVKEIQFYILHDGKVVYRDGVTPS